MVINFKALFLKICCFSKSKCSSAVSLCVALEWFPEVKVFGPQECSEWMPVIPPASRPEPCSCY